ncbi:Golgi-associated plant pathogenesis-related protein 1-like protein [Dinothrombium tinctorium]|uniref:Golgi-associated plant pathogenesis-related protein 1-like protein n=1 Tax=Dinothrombium tinctorium TaxID=1965070 RepID=A0A3S3NIJ2_9ACAR|nr:Golgi-associated plant pathogenesis-related protein 1-like protein [Dinothrombium tinctorium]RWS00613.1 Golgi-associated plant pathogenesis-related protein 1-like protein [Dinothrombium tinctorium]RWS07163.1 Golgi-associated plant pathogenesis-related protein 1-like protein [Dinothrombium tinctorium]
MLKKLFCCCGSRNDENREEQTTEEKIVDDFGNETVIIRRVVTTRTIETKGSKSGISKIVKSKKLVTSNYSPEIEFGELDGNRSLSPVSIDEKKFRDECLKWHNHYRKKHGVPDLVLNSKISAFAKEWAEKLAKSNRFDHRPNNSYGENIYFASSTNPAFVITGKDPVESWYKEISAHKFGKEPTNLSSGHFTQVIWKESKELGVGIGRNGNNFIVVANYSPAGNVIGRFAENVPPPKAR